MRASMAVPLLLLAIASATSMAQRVPTDVALRPPSASERAKRTAVVHAGYRYDDLLWENDRTAHRIYGRRLEAAEPPSGSGIDAWGKKVPWPFMDRLLRTGEQHADRGEGVDFYNVGTARGMGGLGIWHDNKLWTSRNYARHRMGESKPDVADFSVDYAPWPVGVERQVWETRRFTLPAGTHFTRMVSVLSSDDPAELVVGIGISRRATDATRAGRFTADRATGRFTWWGPADPRHGSMGIALLIDPKAIVEVGGDNENHLVFIRATPGSPFVYHAGAAWDRGSGVRTEEDWLAMVRSTRGDFMPPRD